MKINKTKILFLLILFFSIFGLAKNAWAECSGSSPTWTTTPDYASVSSCVSQASDGDTINILTGTETWSSTLSWTGKALKLIGAGVSNTIITLGTQSPVIETDNISGVAGNAVRISGIRFNSANPINIWILLKGQGWRVDHCYFYNSSGASAYFVYAEGSNSGGVQPFGLADNNYFYEGRNYVHGAGATSSMNAAWADNSSIGTANAVYYEDNTYYRISSGGVFNDASSGAKWVMRYNTLIGNDEIFTHSLQAQDSRGTRSWEVYGNSSNNPFSKFIPLRGGTGMVYNNYVTNSSGTYTIAYDNTRNIPGDCVSGCGTWGYCDGTSSADGNTPGQSGWPVQDPVGAPAAQLLSPRRPRSAGPPLGLR